MSRNASCSLLAAVALLGLGACSKSSPPPQAPETTAGSVPAANSAVTVPDTFAVLRQMHVTEVNLGKLAQQNAQDPRVKAFADQMINEHTARLQRDEQLMNALGVQPKESAMSDHIRNAERREAARLMAMSGPDFDRAYIEQQIKHYRVVLDTYDRNLIPNATDPQIKSNLEESRGRANKYLKEAQDIRLSLANQSP